MSEDGSLPLDARAIESEVSRLWRQAAEGAAGGLVRASSLTVLVMLVDPELGERVAAVLAEAPAAHPCRVIVVALDEREPCALLAAYCRPPSPGRPPVCWEEVRLEGSPAALQRVLSAARALVLPNLPVQVWWPGDPDLSSPLFLQVVEIGDRVIVDSSQFADPPASLARYADQAEAEHGTVGFVDLNWRRLEPWRRLLAQFFDTPADRPFLNYVESVSIGYTPAGDGRGGYAAALITLGWIASRLGWVAPQAPLGVGQDVRELRFDDGGRGVRVELRRLSPDEMGGPGLGRVELRAALDGQVATYLVQRSGENASTVAEVDGARREVQVHLPTPGEAALLERELSGFGRDRIYEDALQAIRALGPPAETTTRS